MSANLDFSDTLIQGTVGVEAQCFPGFGSQPRVDIDTVPAAGTVPSAQATVSGTTRYVAVKTDEKVKVFAGPAGTSSGDKAALARVVNAPGESFGVRAGDAVHVWKY
ncbi:MAG: hypothetical protein Q8S03_10135 [Brevundimonas sp.]|uniref:hypothetical protein n=1 Tax=Brevundimonas sp. TaxID=1871086 RepID=UPI0027335F38|nr:hypothetical protein [Brevundimonas sp.]MDP3405037.1 hypothetical protein [Brevundimonas sp.]